MSEEEKAYHRAQGMVDAMLERAHAEFTVKNRTNAYKLEFMDALFNRMADEAVAWEAANKHD